MSNQGRTRAPSFFSTDTPRSTTQLTPDFSLPPLRHRNNNNNENEDLEELRRSPSRSPPQSKSKRKKRRQSTFAKQLSKPAVKPVPQLAPSSYAREHVVAASWQNSRPFKLLEEGFLITDLIKWTQRYSEIVPVPTDNTTNNNNSTAEQNDASNESSSSSALPNQRRKTINPNADNPIYAKFLVECLQGLRFSQSRSMTSIQATVHELEKFLIDHGTEVNWHNRCRESSNNIGQILCQAELVIVCLTALTELEMVFNTTIRLADRVTELRRYWKDLDVQPWRFSAILFSEKWGLGNTLLYELNTDAQKRPYTCSERVEMLNHILDGHMIMLGKAKRLMREVYDIAHEPTELNEKYKNLMDWAHRCFLVVEQRIHEEGNTERNGASQNESRQDGSTSDNTRNDSTRESSTSDANGNINSLSSSLTLVGIVDQMKHDYKESSIILSPFLAPALVNHLKKTCHLIPQSYQIQCRRTIHLEKPSLLQRRWPEFLLSGVVVAGSLFWAKQNDITREDVNLSLSRFGRSCSEFVVEHVTEPAQEIYKEIFLDEYMEVTDPEEVEDSKNSLRKNLRDYLIQKEIRRLDQGDLTKGLFSTHNESELSVQTLASITTISDNMKMSEVMRDYEKELSEPKSNLLMGNIVHLMLIQMQFMKKEIMVSMAKMDDVLKANHLLVNTMSTVPAFVVSYMGYNVLKQIYTRVFQDDKERRNSSIELRITLRDIDQCLNLVAHRSEVDVNGSEIFRMDLRDLGNLAMLLHRFDEQLNMYFIFGKVRPEIQYRMEEDMEELMMEDFSISQRMRVIERFYRSYDVFSSSFKKDFF